jgi:hypothetical protein
MPASEECFGLFRLIADTLKDCGLANSHHDIDLSRGASWVRSKCGPKQLPLRQQTIHFDYDTTKVGDHRLQLPMSIFIYCQDTNLIIIDKEYEFSAGDILLLLGDCPHAGSQWNKKEVNLRLFCFLPTAKCLPTWESGYRDAANVWRYHRNTVHSDGVSFQDLNDQTDPLSSLFNLESYKAHTFCATLAKFFRFHTLSWYNGLQTIAYQGRSCYQSETHENGMFAVDPGVCLHWPSRNSLGRAGLLDRSRACGATFTDLRCETDCPSGQCQKLSKRSSVSISSSSSSLPMSKFHKCMLTHTHTHTHVAADGTESKTVVTQEIMISTSNQTWSSSSFSKSSEN